MHKSTMLIPAAALLAAATVAIGPGAAAQAPATRTLTFKELEKGATFTHVRNTKGAGRRTDLQGDVLALTNELTDTGGRHVGRSHISCVTTTGARNFPRATSNCVGVISLSDGTLTLQGLIRPDKPTIHAAITGGTGAYAGATGEVVSRGAIDTITLAG